MKQSKQEFWQENIHINRVQYAYLMLQAKNKYAIMSRGTGKSFIVGAEVDENVRIMPRGVTTIAQATIGQALVHGRDPELCARPRRSLLLQAR